jgi:hypothetical protein
MKLAFQIGNSFNEIKQLTLGQHYKVQQEIRINPKPQIDIIKMLSGCSDNDIYKLNLDQFTDLWIAFEDYYIKQIQTNKEPEKIITLGDKEYALLDLQQIKVGEFADLDVIATGENSEQKIHEILAILYRPIREKTEFGFIVEDYDGQACKKRSSEFLDLDLGIAMRGLNFFLGSGQAFLNSTLSSLKEMKEKEKNLWLRETYDLILTQLLEAGSAHWLSSQEKMYWNWRGLSNSVFTQPLTGWPGSKIKEKQKKEPFKIFKNYNLVSWQ